MKKCPYCAEDILDEAIKCKHCKSDLQQKNSKQKQPPTFAGDEGEKALKWIAKALLVILAIVVWYIYLAIVVLYISIIHVIIIWYIWKKSKLDKKKKYIGTVLAVVLFGVLIGSYFYLNRTPSLTITEPNDGFTIQSSETIVKGTIDPKDATLHANGVAVKTENGVFSYMAKLADETNILILRVSNSEGESERKITINRTFSAEELAELERQKTEEEAKKLAAEEERKAKELAEQKAWERSKAGQICKAHPEWSKTDCERLADNRVWIGMTMDMLKYKRGLPNSANPSNYGYRIEWQWCWYNYTPSCFYGDDDGIIDSYN